MSLLTLGGEAELSLLGVKGRFDFNSPLPRAADHTARVPMIRPRSSRMDAAKCLASEIATLEDCKACLGLR